MVQCTTRSGEHMARQLDDADEGFTFAAAMDRWMTANNLDYRKAAKLLGIDHGQASRYRRGVSRPLNEAQLLEKMWGVRFADLDPTVEGVNEPSADDDMASGETLFQCGTVMQGGKDVHIYDDVARMIKLRLPAKTIVRGGRGLKFGTGPLYALKVSDDTLTPYYPRNATLLVIGARPEAIRAKGCEVILGRKKLEKGKVTAHNPRMLRLGDVLEADGKAQWLMASPIVPSAGDGIEQLRVSDVHVAWVVCGAVLAR